MRIALLTRSYPRDGDLYQYPFVHRRVVSYRAAGHEVRVLRLSSDDSVHVFEGVECRAVALEQFVTVVAQFSPNVIAAHGPDERMWPALEALEGRWPVCAWLHGSEIPGIFREKANWIADASLRRKAFEEVEHRAEFWRDALAPWPAWLNLVFPSANSVDLMRSDLGQILKEDRITIVPNPIDTDLFACQPKVPNDVLNILSIRPYDSPTYGNDLAVEAVQELARHPKFLSMKFTFFGDGLLFESTLAPLRNFGNVSINRGFLRQDEIAEVHQAHGVFLVPSRLDTQGVSRDEAMASGLVPVTSRVFAIPEFVDETCGVLTDPDDSIGLARAIAEMVEAPALFMSRSRAAVARVRELSSHRIVIPQEVELMVRSSLCR